MIHEPPRLTIPAPALPVRHPRKSTPFATCPPALSVTPCRGAAHWPPKSPRSAPGCPVMRWVSLWWPTTARRNPRHHGRAACDAAGRFHRLGGARFHPMFGGRRPVHGDAESTKGPQALSPTARCATLKASKRSDCPRGALASTRTRFLERSAMSASALWSAARWSTVATFWWVTATASWLSPLRRSTRLSQRLAAVKDAEETLEAKVKAGGADMPAIKEMLARRVQPLWSTDPAPSLVQKSPPRLLPLQAQSGGAIGTKPANQGAQQRRPLGAHKADTCQEGADAALMRERRAGPPHPAGLSSSR